jgi:hypothetical protein
VGIAAESLSSAKNSLKDRKVSKEARKDATIGNFSWLGSELNVESESSR